MSESSIWKHVSAPPHRRRRDANQQLRLSDATLRIAFDSSPDAIALTTAASHRFVEVNRGFERMFGYSSAEAIGCTALELGLWEDVSEFDELLAIRAGAPLAGLELRYRTRDGEAGVAHVSIGGVFGVGEDEFTLSIARDVSEHRRTEDALAASEAQYRRLFESANDAIAIIREERFVECNNQMLEMLQRSRHEIIGTTWWALSPLRQSDGSDSAALYQHKLRSAYEGDRIEFEWTCTRSDGTPFETEIRASLLSSEPSPTLICNIRDVSQNKRAEAELRQAYEQIAALRDQLEAENVYLREEAAVAFGKIIGESRALRTTLRKIDLVAPTDSTVLILGESGTGKELVAYEIHQRSPRGRRTMIRVNCASIPSELYESEFFGHTKGAFTGAVKDRAGRFELAQGGTIFLDEVAEIPLEMQSKLLRVLQEGEYERVGDDTTRKTNVRVIAATNRDLTREIEEGRFREDLFYRLNVFPIHVAPLRDRREDIPLLTRHFLTTMGRKMKRPLPRVGRAHMEQLQAYHWPGNVRELQNILERAMITHRGGTLEFDLPREAVGRSAAAMVEPGAEPPFVTERELRRRERDNLTAVLQHVEGRIFGEDGAAALLGVKPTTLASRIKKLKLRKPG